MKPFKYRFHRNPDFCGGLSMGGKYDCENPIVAGVVQRLVLITKADWDANAIITYDETVPTMITDIVLENLAVGYLYEGIRKSINPQSAYTPSTLSSTYDHQIEFLIFDISAEMKYNIEEMCLSKGVVAIAENSNSEGNDNSVFEVFGKDIGMQVQAGPMRINGDVDTNGAYTINLKTSDDMGKEPHLPASLWAADYATTRAIVDALLEPVIPPL